MMANPALARSGSDRTTRTSSRSVRRDAGGKGRSMARRILSLARSRRGRPARIASHNGALQGRPSPMDVRIDQVGLDDYERWMRATETAFGTRITEAQLERWRTLFDPDRTLAAFEGNRIVGTTGTNIMRLTIPGAAIDMAGVVAVGVLPTHRR